MPVALGVLASCLVVGGEVLLEVVVVKRARCSELVHVIVLDEGEELALIEAPSSTDRSCLLLRGSRNVNLELLVLGKGRSV